MMITESELEKIVATKIEADETLGERTSPLTGHVSYGDYRIDEISTPKKVEKGWEVTYRYTIIITTEFTVLPHNPPYEYRYEKTIILGDDGNIVEESFKVYLDDVDDNDD